MRILVVDDDADVTLVLGDALRARGHLVAVATTGHEAIDRAAAFHPDAALVDIGLPDIDGVTLAELLRGATGRPLRIIALSGFPEAALRAAVGHDHFDDFLLKPAKLDAIDRALRAGRRRAESSIVWPRSRHRPASA